MTKTEKTRASGSIRVARGGSWLYIPLFARDVLRINDASGHRIDLGVRLVEVLDE